jgi:transcriptional regulator with GAF, ATPase, and Fis domain
VAEQGSGSLGGRRSKTVRDMAFLYAIAGPLQGAVFQLHTEEVGVGRQASNQMCVGDPSVSRQHCLIQPSDSGFQIRDLGSNNGTFINGKRVEECALEDGDKIRIGDTVFRFSYREELSLERQLNLPDNGVVTVTGVEQRGPGSAETAVQRLFKSAGPSDDATRWAKTLLRIGAALNTWPELETLPSELLKLIVEVVPAQMAAIVLLAQNPNSESTLIGWDVRSGESAGIQVSRTLIRKALTESVATFSDDVTVHQDLSELSSLTNKRVVSVIVVPLAVEERTIGAIYLDSADPLNRLRSEHLDLVAMIASQAASALERGMRLNALKEQNLRLLSILRLDHNLIGCSQPMRDVVERIAKVARTDATVVIRGETGTGKELAAQAIHQNSARAARPFEAINCAVLRDTFLESELFGHEKGSFTGAITQRKGKLELADGGTVFLDELGELGEAPQAMLLRVLQTREFQRLGGSRTKRVDIRIIAATNQDLEEAVKSKTLREDLYYRLNVVSIAMPPLRERREDVPLLADHFLQLYSRKNKRLVTKVSREAMSLLVQYDWPGNVRELENAIEHGVVFGASEEILPEDLPETLLVTRSTKDAVPLGYHDAVLEAKRNIVRSALAQASGGYSEAANLLGIHVNNLHRLMRDLRMKPMPKANRSLDANAKAVTVD